MNNTLTLFDDFLEIDKRKKTSWSNSKIGALESCPRKYYYNYYGSKKKVALSESKKDNLLFLSKLSNRYLFPGTVVHDVIKLYFQKAKRGDEWDLKKLLWLAETKVLDAIKYSVEKRNGVETNYQFEPALLKEIYFAESNEEELKSLMLENVNNCLHNFTELDKFSQLIVGGKQAKSIIEEYANFEVNDSVAVTGKIDIAYLTDENKFIVADWKTGKNDEDESSLQLLVYALWAVKKYKINENDLMIQKAFLNTGQLETLKFSMQELEKARIRIIQSAETIQELDHYGINATEEAFTPVMQEKICALCPYKQICYKN